MKPASIAVEVLNVPTEGAAAALLVRVLRLQNAIKGAKQYIFTLQGVSLSSIESHKEAGSHITPENYSFLTPRNPDCEKNSCQPNPSRGLIPLLAELGSSDVEQAKSIHDIWNSQESDPPFAKILARLDQHTDSLADLISKNRLGKLHQQNEAALIAKANSVNVDIGNLKVGCFLPSVPEPLMDAYFVAQRTRRSLDVFQAMELEYTRQCIHEGQAIKHLENVIFETMAEIPPEHKRLIARAMGLAKDALAVVETKANNVHLAADWEAFETSHRKEFPDKNTIKMTPKNHPNEDQFLQFQRLPLPRLQRQYILRTSLNGKRLTGLPKLKASLAGKKQYGTPGRTWALSEAGDLIEYDVDGCHLMAMWSLRKCKLGELKEEGDFGYFSLRGTKMKVGKRRMEKGRKKEYNFRLPIEEAAEAYNVLKVFSTIP
jgi:hypothetical protein